MGKGLCHPGSSTKRGDSAIALLNYTTTITVTRTLGDIQRLLASGGASSVTVDYKDQEPAALTFTISTHYGGKQAYRLPANVAGVWSVLQDTPGAKKTWPHAARVAWRIVKDWVEVQLALVASQQATLDQIMLPYAVIDPQGTTVYEAYVQHGQKLLTGGR